MNGMNGCCALAASILCLWAASCADSEPREPAGQSGGPAAGDSSDAGSGATPGAAGTSSQVGGSAGASTGGSLSAGASVGGSAGGAGEPTAGDGGSAGASPSGPYHAVLGQLCPIESTIGVVELMLSPAPSVQASLFDRPDPWIGEPELRTSTCEFHRYVPGVCGACEAGEVCSLASQCVPERRTIKNASLRISTGAEERRLAADPQLGGIYSPLDIGDASSTYAMTLSWDDTEVRLDAMSVARSDLGDAMVTVESDDYDMPGALDASWEPSADDSIVRSRIPINHHAGGPTFTDCRAPVSTGAFHADAAMINPLAVRTGLEFQSVQHVFVAAAATPQGCVEFRFGDSIPVSPF